MKWTSKLARKFKTIRQIKSRIWEMKGGKYSKTLAKIWVEGIIRILDSRDAIRIRDIEDAILELIRMSPNMADGNQQKHLLASFATKAWIYS